MTDQLRGDLAAQCLSLPRADVERVRAAIEYYADEELYFTEGWQYSKRAREVLSLLPRPTEGNAHCRLCNHPLLTTYDASLTLLVRAPEDTEWGVYCPGCGVRLSDADVRDVG